MAKDTLCKVGTGGLLFSTICCWGIPAVTALFSTVGIGFVINDAVLLPAMFLFLVMTGVGLFISKKKHGRKEPLMLFAISAVLLSLSIWFTSIGTAIGLIVMVSATVLNIRYSKKCEAEGCGTLTG